MALLLAAVACELLVAADQEQHKICSARQNARILCKAGVTSHNRCEEDLARLFKLLQATSFTRNTNEFRRAREGFRFVIIWGIVGEIVSKHQRSTSVTKQRNVVEISMQAGLLLLLLLHSEVNDSNSACAKACSNPVLSMVPGNLKDVALALVALDKGAISDAPDVQVPSKATTSQVVTTAVVMLLFM
jgi:hypothetical protein